MSRKHFEAIARALLLSAPNNPEGESYRAERALFQRIVSEIGDVCSRSNPRFDRGRFEKASGV